MKERYKSSLNKYSRKFDTDRSLSQIESQKILNNSNKKNILKNIYLPTNLDKFTNY